MPSCPNCGRDTMRTEDWVCQWCGYPLLSKSYKKIDKTYKQLQEERSSAGGYIEPELEAGIPVETRPEPAPEPLPPTAPEHEAETQPEPVAEVKPEPAPETPPAPEPEPAPLAEVKTGPVPGTPTPAPEPEPAPLAEVKTGPVPGTPTPAPEPEPAPVAEVKPEPVPETPPAPEPEPAPMAEVKPEPVPETPLAPEPEPTSVDEAKPESVIELPPSAPLPASETVMETKTEAPPPSAPEPSPPLVPAPVPVVEEKPEPISESPPAPVPASPPAVPEKLEITKNGVVTTVAALNHFFQTDRAGTNTKLKDQTIRVTGEVEKVFVRDHLDIRYIVLTSEPKAGPWSVRCSFEKEAVPELNRLSTGQSVTVQGIYDGYGKNIIIKECSIIA